MKYHREIGVIMKIIKNILDSQGVTLLGVRLEKIKIEISLIGNIFRKNRRG